jgi:Subtilase family/Viral BACON domain
LKKILISLLLAVCAQSAMAQRVVLGHAQDLPLRASAQQHIAKGLDTLRTTVANTGTIRVIVGVRAGFAAEGTMGAASVGQQRGDIAGMQTALIDKVPSLKQPGKDIKRFANIPFMALEVTAAELEALAALSETTSIEEDRLSAPFLAESVPLIGGAAARASGFSGAGQMVAVLDTGVDRTHPFLSGKVVSEACFSRTVASQGSTSVCPGGVSQSTAAGSGVNCPSGVSGCNHGTHVAGIVAGRGTSFSGVARDADVLAVQVFSSFSSAASCGSSPVPCALSYSSDQILGLERVFALRTTYNIASVNMSLGGGQYFTQASCDAANIAFKAAVDNLRSVNIATVIASGNSGYTNSMGSPGCVSTAVSVGATWDAAAGGNSCSNNNLGNASTDQIACYSNSASFLSLLAPGSLINSSVPGAAYSNFNGTSMAAPHVAGAWAVLKQRVPSLTVTAGLNSLTTTGVAITDPRNGLTKRRIQLDAALTLIGGVACTYAVSPATEQSFNSNSQAGATITVTAPAGCAWTAASSASWATVTAGATGTGNGSVAFSVASNLGTTSRNAVLTVAGQAIALTQTGVAASLTNKVDIRTYVPAAAAAGGYVSYVRVINTGTLGTAVSVAAVDGDSGSAGLVGQLVASLPVGAAMTFTAAQVEAAMGGVPAGKRPRIRVFAASGATIEVQSFLLQPGGAFNEVSGGQSGASVTVRTYVPAAAASGGYVSYVRVINTGSVDSAVTVARVHPATGETSPARTLIPLLPAGAALTYTAAQVESALGIAIAAAERPRLLVSAASSTLEVQSFLIQPGGAFTEVSSGKAGSTVDVPSYVPAASSGYKSFIRVMNTGAQPAPVSAALVGANGTAGTPRTIIAMLPAFGAMTLPSDEIESTLGVAIAAAERPRLRISSAVVGLEVQSFLLQPGGAYNEISNAITGTSVVVRTYVPAVDSATGYTSYLRVINTGGTDTPVTMALINGNTGVQSNSVVITTLPAGAAQTFTSSQIESAMGVNIAAGSRPRIAVSGNNVLEVQSFLTQPGGAFTEVSGGQ